MKKIVAISIGILLLALIVVRLVMNYKAIQKDKNVDTDLPYVSVTAVKAQRMVLRDSLQLAGYTEAITEVDVAAETSGKLVSLRVETGDQVRKGEVLAVVDNYLKELALEKSERAVSNYKRDLDRMANLFGTGSVSQQMLDNAQNMYDDAVIMNNQMKKQLTDATIKAPASGIISKKQVEEGEFVNIGAPLVTITDISSLKIRLLVAEKDIYKLTVNQEVDVYTDIYPEAKMTGKIRFISPKGDDAHNYPVEISMANSTEYPLKSGTFVKVRARLPESSEALYIPREALLGSIEGAEVYVAKDNRVTRRQLTAGRGNDQYIEVLAGLTAGEWVVTNGQINLVDGKEIRIID